MHHAHAGLLLIGIVFLVAAALLSMGREVK
jgi:hypothetical protein